MDGEPLTGTWFNRTQEHAARRRRGEDPEPLQYTATETVTFSPLPCWEHLSPEAYRERVGKMTEQIEEKPPRPGSGREPSRSARRRS